MISFSWQKNTDGGTDPSDNHHSIYLSKKELNFQDWGYNVP
jgi:hypothetical protein